MTYSEALKTGIQILKAANIEAPAADAGALLCYAANCGRVFLYAHGDSVLGEEQLQKYLSALKKRAQGYPLQYLTGMQEFMSLTFEVGPGVLIPRQETELLVETVIRYCEGRRSEAEKTAGGYSMSVGVPSEGVSPEGILSVATPSVGLPSEGVPSEGVSPEGILTMAAPSEGLPPEAGRPVIDTISEHGAPLSILDIGTGSGCIAVSLAYYVPYSVVTAVDKMEDALTIAGRNALKNGVEGNVDFVKGDLFQNIRGKTFDVIVSNPPYIRSGDIPALMREVRDHEPRTALDGGNDGLDFYREIIRLAPSYLKQGGLLAFETGYDQAGDVASLMSPGFVEIKTFRDLSGIDRVVSGILAGCPSLYTKFIP